MEDNLDNDDDEDLLKDDFDAMNDKFQRTQNIVSTR